MGLDLRSPGWTSICQGEVWDLLSLLQGEKDGKATVELGRRDAMWKGTCLQGRDLWKTQPLGRL